MSLSSTETVNHFDSLSAEFLDLRAHPNVPLLRRVYDELYLTTFIDSDEQETFEQYRSRLFDVQQPPPQPVTHFVVAGRGLDRAANAELLGFIILEAYRESGCGLLTYLVTVPTARGQGLGQRLIARAQSTLQADMEAWHGAPGALRAIFAEMHNPTLVPRERDVFDPALRLQIMQRFGASLIPIEYVQPELVPGGERSRKLLLTTFPLDGTAPVQCLSQAVVAKFLHEFYLALGVATPDGDPDYQAMCADLSRAVGEPPVSSTTPLPLVRLTA